MCAVPSVAIRDPSDGSAAFTSEPEHGVDVVDASEKQLVPPPTEFALRRGAFR
jgi:hypothetical protein